MGGTFASPLSADQAQSLFGIKERGNLSDVIGYLAYSQTEIGKTGTWTEYAKLVDETASTTIGTPVDPQITHVKRWATWKIEHGDQFHIDVISSPELNDERMQAIQDVVFSKGTLAPDEKTLYKGWYGAISSTKNAKFPMSIDLRTVRSYDGTGHILIELTHLKNPDGYVAFTKSVSDKEIHTLLQSKITVYNVENLSIDDFKRVLRHELGHAFGLSHSDDPDDLMYEIVKTPYPYISQCDVDTLAGLYNGSETSWVSCET